MSSRPTLYYETLFCGLVTVKPVKRLEYGAFQVRVARANKAYRLGELLDVPARNLVNKAGVRNGFIRVRSADVRLYFA